MGKTETLVRFCTSRPSTDLGVFKTCSAGSKTYAATRLACWEHYFRFYRVFEKKIFLKKCSKKRWNGYVFGQVKKDENVFFRASKSWEGSRPALICTKPFSEVPRHFITWWEMIQSHVEVRKWQKTKDEKFGFSSDFCSWRLKLVFWLKNMGKTEMKILSVLREHLRT